MTRAFKAFLASTYRDLAEHRKHVIEALRKSKFHVDPMEDWSADSGEPKEFCPERVAGCDLLVLLVGRRRGFIPEGEAQSITQWEYRLAREQGIEVLAFLLDDKSLWLREFDELDRDLELARWREQLTKSHVCKTFDHRPESVPISEALNRWLLSQSDSRSDSPAGRPQVGVGLSSATVLPACGEQLKAAVDRLSGQDKYKPDSYVVRDIDAYLWRFLEAEDAQFFPLIGPPGTGKTSAICNLANRLIRQAWPGVLLDTSEFHLRGQRRHTIDAVIVDALQSRLPVDAPRLGHEQGLARVNRFMHDCMPDRCFVVIIDGLDELRFVSQVGAQGFPVSADALADLIRGSQSYDRLKFVVTCRTSPWRETFGDSGAIRRIVSALPPRHDEEVELKQIESAQQADRKGPEVAMLETFNDVELSLAVAKYQQKYGVRVHLAGEAREDARDPFMLGAAFMSWAEDKATRGHRARYYYVEEATRGERADRLPQWTVDYLDYFDKLGEYWKERLARIVDSIRDFSADRPWARRDIEREIAGLLGGMVDYMVERGKSSVPLAKLTGASGARSELRDLVLQRMAEAELIAFSEDPYDPADDRLRFYTHRHMEYQLGQRILRRLRDEGGVGVNALVELVRAHDEVLRQPFQLALREIVRLSKGVPVETRDAVVQCLFEHGAADLTALACVVDQMPFLPEEDRDEHFEKALWCAANHLWALNGSVAVAEIPATLAEACRRLGRLAESLEEILRREDVDGLGDDVVFAGAMRSPAGDVAVQDPFAGATPLEGKSAGDSRSPDPSAESDTESASRAAPSGPDETAPDALARAGNAKVAIRKLCGEVTKAGEAVRRLHDGMDLAHCREVMERAASLSRAFSRRDVLALAAVCDTIRCDSLGALLDRASASLEDVSEAVRALLPVVQGEGTAESRAMDCRRLLCDAIQDVVAVYDDVSEQIDRLFRINLTEGAESGSGDAPESLMRTLPGVEVRDVEEVTSFACTLLVRPEPVIGRFGERLIRMIYSTGPRDFPVEHRVHNLGNDRYKQGNFEGAIRLFDLALCLDPDLVETWFNRGLALTRLQRYPEAHESLDRVLALNPRLAEAHYTKGLVFEYAMEYTEAIACYRRALEEDEGYEKARTQIDVADRKRRLPEEGHVEPERPEETLDPNSSEWCIREAQRQVGRRNYSGAEALYRQAFARLKDAKRKIEPDLFREWAYCLLSTVHAQEAIEAYLTIRDGAIARKLNGGEVASAFNGLGCLYSDREAHLRAEFYYLAALAADPNDWAPQCNLLGMLVGESLPEYMVDLDAAEREARRLGELDSRMPSSFGTLAQVIRQRNEGVRVAACVECLRKAASLDHYGAVFPCAELMDHYQEAGDWDTAYSFGRRVVDELYPHTEGAAMDHYLPSSLCEWYQAIAECARFVTDESVLAGCVEKIREMILGSGLGAHVPPEIRLHSRVSESMVPVRVFLEHCEGLMR